MAIVLKDLGWDQFLVRLVGSLQEFEVNKSELRVRQSYQNGEWIVIGKVPKDYKDANYTKILKYDQDSGSQANQKDTKWDFNMKDLCFDTQNNGHLMDSHVVSSKTLKRASPCCYFQDETNEERVRKFRSEKEGRQAPVMGILELNDTDSVMSSSDSCSINSYKHYEIYHGSGFVEDHESDAESVCQFGYPEGSQSQETDKSAASEAVADEIHRLELNAYRYTMVALHAWGPLNWEKETMGQSTDL